MIKFKNGLVDRSEWHFNDWELNPGRHELADMINYLNNKLVEILQAPTEIEMRQIAKNTLRNFIKR